jgi:uncharacterized protein YeaO (DUF488 family)
MAIRVERAYAPAHPAHGRRYLVDRVWPRGLKRDTLRLDDWLRAVAPSDELRKWFGHDPERWEEFKKRYFKELDANADALSELVAAAKHGEVTLLFGAKDEEHNNAVALRAYLEQKAHRRAPAGTR